MVAAVRNGSPLSSIRELAMRATCSHSITLWQRTRETWWFLCGFWSSTAQFDTSIFPHYHQWEELLPLPVSAATTTSAPARMVGTQAACPNLVRKLFIRFNDASLTSSFAFSAWAMEKAPSSRISLNPRLSDVKASLYHFQVASQAHGTLISKSIGS